MPNMYEYFVSQGLSLGRPSSLFSFIVPDRLGFNKQFVKLRKRILFDCTILSLMYKAPFPGVTADTLVFVLEKSKSHVDHVINIGEYGKVPVPERQQQLLQSPTYVFEYFEGTELRHLASRIIAVPAIRPLRTICKTTSGFGGKSELLSSVQITPSQIETFKGDSIGRYSLRSSYWFDFKQENITGRTTDKTKLGAIPKILLRKTGTKIVATYDDSGTFPEQSLYFLFANESGLDFKYILGLLNSRFMSLYYQTKTLTNKKSIAQSKKSI